MQIDISNWFEEREERVEMGVELELFLFDMDRKEPMRDGNLLESILHKLPRNIYRDHYPHQLEIRTTPHDNPEEVINETKELYQLASKELMKENIYIIPAPNITDNGYMWCGMHVHISYPDRTQTAPYYNKAMNMYPFVLSLADHTKNFEVDFMNNAQRINNSRHIGLPYLQKKDFLVGNEGDRKYRDIILSKETDGDGRHRLSKPSTIELRIFDTPSLFSTYEFMIRYLFSVARTIKVNAPVTDMIEKDFKRAEHLVRTTRNLVVNQRYGINKFFHMTNTNVCDDVAKAFGIPFNRKTQFEFREDLGVSANINGYLSMAIEGGWLD